MKLDKIRFAQLIAFISRIGATVARSDIDFIDELIDVDEPKFVDATLIDNLLEAVSEGRRIDAMRVHRVLTGSTLKEASHVIDAHCKQAPPKAPVLAKLHDFQDQ